MHKTGAMSPHPPSQRPDASRLLAGALALFAVVLAVFHPALGGEFVYDDALVIQQNPQLAQLSNLPSIFGSSYWGFLDAASTSHVGYYRPLTMTLLTFANVFGGGAAGLFHWFSLIVYGASCIAAWRFAARLLRSERAGFLAALLFAVHPLHVESVAWISALHDPLYATFGFFALERCLRWRDDGASGYPWIAGLWFLLALLSKDAAVAILPVAFVLDWVRRKDTEESNHQPGLKPLLVPFVLVFGIYYALRAAVFGDALAGFDHQATDFGVGLGRLALLRVELLGGAMALLVWPAELNLFRPFQPEFASGSYALLVGCVGSLVLLALTGLAWKRRSWVNLSLLLLIPVSLAPVLLKVDSLGSFPLSDRFLFVPVLGMTGLVAYLLCRGRSKPLAVGATLVLTVAMGARSYAHLPYWQDNEVLFRHALDQNPRNPNVYWGLGRVMLERYRKTGLSDHLLESRSLFEHGMDLLAEGETEAGADIFKSHDDHLQMNLGLGWCLLYEAEVDPFHDYKSVRVVFDRAIEYAPTNELGHIGVGVAWLGEGDPNKASNAFRKALDINPNSPEAHRNMGLLLMRIEEWAGAAAEFRICTQLRPNSPGDLIFLARAELEAGNAPAARSAADEAHRLRPEDPDPVVLIGQVLEKSRRFDEALTWFDRALKNTPNHGMAHLHRGKVLAQLNQRSSAVTSLMRACELLPNSFAANYDLMVLLLASSQPESAVPYFLVAYRTRPNDHGLRLNKAAQALHRDDIRILGALATIDADRGDFPTARSWIEQAIKVSPQNPAVNFTYGAILTKMEEHEAAEGPLRIAAEGLPTSYEAQMEYGDLLLGLHRELESEPYLANALILLDGVDMEPGLKKATRKALQTGLTMIGEMKIAGPPAPPAKQ
ncbi:MAG: tetratricopeptide (TPR) repeat protein [Candidatus Paceibacteria bacterium]|jgi:tetratricopeptide (TPR) repeat protein